MNQKLTSIWRGLEKNRNNILRRKPPVPNRGRVHRSSPLRDRVGEDQEDGEGGAECGEGWRCCGGVMV